MSSYGDLIRAAQAGDVKPVYLLAGSDAFLEDNFIREVASTFLPAEARKKVVSLDDERADDGDHGETGSCQYHALASCETLLA